MSGSGMPLSGASGSEVARSKFCVLWGRRGLRVVMVGDFFSGKGLMGCEEVGCFLLNNPQGELTAFLRGSATEGASCTRGACICEDRGANPPTLFFLDVKDSKAPNVTPKNARIPLSPTMFASNWVTGTRWVRRVEE